MAVLTSEDLQGLRSNLLVELSRTLTVKERINAAFQAIEDTFSSAGVQQAFSTAIDTALSPEIVTNAQKRQLIKFWLRNRFDRGN